MTQANNTTETRKTGVSFQQKRNNYFEREVKPVNIAGHEVTTAAQAMTLIGYGDCGKNNVPLRSLDYKVKCEDYQDLIKCIDIINSYNDFDCERIRKYTQWRLNLQHYLNEGNPNNGKSLFDFHIARESSPAFYVSYNGKFSNKIIKDTEDVKETATQPAGQILYWQEYTEDDFRENMQTIATQIGADEFSIQIDYTYNTGENSLKARFWFD